MNIINKPDAPVRSEGTFQTPPTFRERLNGRWRRNPEVIVATPAVDEMLAEFTRYNADRMAQDHARLRATVTDYTAGQRLDPRSFDPLPEYVYGTGRIAPTRMWQIEPTQVAPVAEWVTPEEVEETSRW
jgi:hypothetical protein